MSTQESPLQLYQTIAQMETGKRSIAESMVIICQHGHVPGENG